MNTAIEIIDGVPYILRRVPDTEFPCDSCVLDNTSKCSKADYCNGMNGFNTNYRYLTTKDREKIVNLVKRRQK